MSTLNDCFKLKNKNKKIQNVYIIVNINIENKCFYYSLSLYGEADSLVFLLGP